jgi:hypothetical protein
MQQRNNREIFKPLVNFGSFALERSCRQCRLIWTNVPTVFRNQSGSHIKKGARSAVQEPARINERPFCGISGQSEKAPREKPGNHPVLGGPVATEPKVRFRPETGPSGEVRRAAPDPKRTLPPGRHTDRPVRPRVSDGMNVAHRPFRRNGPRESADNGSMTAPKNA